MLVLVGALVGSALVEEELGVGVESSPSSPEPPLVGSGSEGDELEAGVESPPPDPPELPAASLATGPPGKS